MNKRNCLGITRSGRKIYQGYSAVEENNNILIVGNPSTGKSTKARMIEKEFNRNGSTIVRINHHGAGDVDAISDELRKAFELESKKINLVESSLNIPLSALYGGNSIRDFVSGFSTCCNLPKTQAQELTAVVEEAADEGIFPSQGLEGVAGIIKEFNQDGRMIKLAQNIEAITSNIKITDGDFFATPGGVVELDFNGIPESEQMQCVEFVLRIIYKAAQADMFKSRGVIISIDESEYLDYKKSIIKNFIMDSRKKGVGILVSTSDLKLNARSEMDVLLKCGTKLYFHPDDILIKKIAKNLDPVQPYIWERRLRLLVKGEFIVDGTSLEYDTGEEVTEPQKIVASIVGSIHRG